MTKTTSKNIAGRVVAAVLALAIAALSGAWATGYAITGNANPTKWTSLKPTTDITPRTVAISSDGQPLTNGGTYAMPRSFTFLSERMGNVEYVAGGEITLTAELSNEYINGRFDWSVDFANPDAAWAQGKVASYYVGLEPIDDGRQVKMKYLAPFSEQIILTAKLQGTESAASCTIDCLKAVTLENSTFHGDDFDDTLCVESYVNLGAGTVEGDFALTYVHVALQSSFINGFENYLNFDVAVKPFFTSTIYSVTPETINNRFLLSVDVAKIEYSMFIEGFDDYDQDHKDAIYYAWNKAYSGNSDNTNTVLDFAISYNYAGVVVCELEESDLPGSNISGNLYAYDVSPSVTLNKNIVF